MARRIVTFEDFTGGHYRGGNDGRQPMNTWRGVDVDVSPSTGYLLRRDENLYPSGRTSATTQTRTGETSPGVFTWASFSPAAITGESESHANSGPVITDGSTVYNPAAVPNLTSYPYISWFQQTGSAAGGTCYPFVWCLGWGRAQVLPSVGDPAGNIVCHSNSNYGTTILFPGTTSLGVFNTYMATWSTVATPTAPLFSQLAIFGDFIVGAARDYPNRLYFQLTASVGSTWSTYYEIGDRTLLTAIVVDRDRVLIGKRDGWYSFTGDPLDVDTVTVRRISNSSTPLPFTLTPTKNLRGTTVRLDEGGAEYIPVQGNPATYFGGGLAGVTGDVGTRIFAGAMSQPDLVVPYTSTVTGMVGIEPVADSANMLIVAPGAPLGSLPYDPLEVGHWVRKSNDRWFHWTTDGLPSGSIPCTDYRNRDLSPRDTIIWITSPSSNGSQLTVAASALNLYTDFPTSWKPVVVELAPYTAPRPFRLSSVMVTYDVGPLQRSDGSSPYGVAEVSVRAGMISHQTPDQAWSATTSERVDVAGGDDGDTLSRRVRVVMLSPTDVPTGNDLTLQVTLAGARLRRVDVVIDEDDWPT